MRLRLEGGIEPPRLLALSALLLTTVVMRPDGRQSGTSEPDPNHSSIRNRGARSLTLVVSAPGVRSVADTETITDPERPWETDDASFDPIPDPER